MRRSIIVGALAAFALSAAGSASAAELLVLNILPGQTLWYLDDQKWGVVDADAYSIKPHPGGQAKLQLLDENAGGETKVVSLDPAQIATAKGRSFWCVVGRPDATTDLPKVVLMSKAQCQRYIDKTFP